MSDPEPRWCAVCGRVITWRKKWARDWAQIRVCSQRCRRTRLDETDRALEQHLRDALAARRTASPADAAEAVGAAPERARSAARRIIATGEAVAVQGGRTVDASTAKGPFALRSP